ncbi:MAG: HEAT repeat domain-containing protein, partial [Spirochaetales bacterium]|nr:HEAT repeat domain-containing protein [Spirochaetales bacterium]
MIPLNPAWLMFFCMLFIDILTGIIFIVSGRNRQKMEQKRKWIRSIISESLGNHKSKKRMTKQEIRFIRTHKWLFLEECSKISDSIRLTEQQQEIILGILSQHKIDVYLIRDLHSKNQYIRLRAASYLPLLRNPHLCPLLIHTLEREHCRLIKLYLINALSGIGTAHVIIPSIIDSLAGEPLNFQKKIWGLLSELGDDLVDLIPLFKQRTEKEIRLLLIHFAKYYRSGELKTYLESLVDSGDLDIAHEATRVLSTVYVASIDHERYLTHSDFLIRNLVAESLGNLPTDKSLHLLLSYINDPVIRKSARLALTAMIRKQPRHFNTIMIRCIKEENPVAHATLIDVLSQFADYLMEKLLSKDAEMIECLIFEIIQQGKMKDIISFLNRNTNSTIKQNAIKILRWLIVWDAESYEER